MDDSLHKLHIIPFSFQISLDTDGKNAWKTCVTRDKVKLPTGLYFGASAATGGLSGFKFKHSLYLIELSMELCFQITMM